MKTKLTVLQRCIICIMSIGVRPIVVIRHIVVKLKWPTTVNGKIEKSKNILTKTTGNPNLPSPYPTNVCSLAQLGTDIAAVDTAQANVNARVIGAPQDRNSKQRTVKLDLESMMSMVQIKADANPANAENIILSFGFDFKVVVFKQRQKAGAKRTTVIGVYMLLGEGGGEHEWQLSADKINMIYVAPTSAAHTLSPVLTLKQTYYMRSRKIGTKGVVFEWTPWFEFTVI